MNRKSTPDPFDGKAAWKSRWVIFGLSLGITFGLTPQLTRGQTCFESCQNSCGSVAEIVREGCVDTCASSCKKEPPKPYGSVAFGTHGAEGISWARQTREEADRDALASCGKIGPNCKIVFRYQYTCAALAVATGAQHYEAATGYSEKDAEANATSVCQQSWGKCLTNLSACSAAGAGRANPPAPPKATSWGAIAYSTADMGAGWSQGKSDRSSAEKEAMNTCSQRGRACVLRAAFNKQCGALAADRDFAGSGVSTDPREAQRKAVDECTKAGGERCVLHISFCSF